VVMSGITGNFMFAGNDAVILNTDEGVFSGDGLTGNYMNADHDARIVNEEGSSFSFDGVTGNVMVAGHDAVIVNSASRFALNGLSGNLMFAGNDAVIVNTAEAEYSAEGMTGNYLNAENDAVISNEGKSKFSMSGISGNVLVADRNAGIFNDGHSEFRLEGLNGGVMLALGGDARIVNTGGSSMTFEGVTRGAFEAAGKVEILNDQSSVLNFRGLNTFVFDAPHSLVESEGLIQVDGVTVFEGLDDLHNYGTISMQNGAAGDLLVTSGNYSAHSILAVDTDMTPGGKTDLLRVGGSTSGVTHVLINDLSGGPGDYDPSGVLFAIVDGDTDPSHFSTGGGRDKGLFRYDAYLTPGSGSESGKNEWRLASTLDGEAYEFTALMAGAQALWNASTGTWNDRTADLRTALLEGSSVAAGCAKDCGSADGNVTPGLWMKALGGAESRDVSNTSAPPPGMQGQSYTYDNSYDQDYLGFLIGADAGEQWTTDAGRRAAWMVGAMSGYAGSRLSFDETGNEADFTAFSLGGYASYLNGGFFLDATLKAEMGEVDYSAGLGAGYSMTEDASFISVGGMLDAGYRVGLGSSAFFEPKASLSYVTTSMEDMQALGSTISFEDGESLQGRLGARLGTSLSGEAVKAELFVEASAWNDFKGDYTVDFATAGDDASADLDLGGAYGEIAAGANLFGGDGKWNGFVTGAVQFGQDDFLGYNGNLGLRYNW